MEYEHKMECFAVPVTKEDLKKILNVSIPTIDNLMRRKEINFLKIRGAVRFSKENIEEYLQRCERKNVVKKNANSGEK